MPGLKILQSLWSMERHQSDGIERSLDESLRLIGEAGFDGVSTHWSDREKVRHLSGLLTERGMIAEGQGFPVTVDDLKPVLEIAVKYPVHHLTLQPDVRPLRLADAIPLIEGWLRLGEEAGVPVFIETHRNRITNDLPMVLDLLDRFPTLRLVADLSHFVVGREIVWPVSEENHALMRRILDRACALHGRVASCEQVQLELSFPHHRPWIDLFLGWWDYGLRSMRRRLGEDADLCFTCELGPKPYAISGRDGNDTTDRWQESLQMKAMVEQLAQALPVAPAGPGRAP